MKRRAALGVLLLVALWLYAGRWSRMPPAPTGVAAALAESTIPIASDDPDSPDSDLLPLVPVLADRRVIALGEATHGTREFFRLKDRFLRLLVRHASFTTFALEISPESGERVNRYIHNGSGSGRAALREFEFWTWQTEEVLALIEWMRAWNTAHPERPVSFVGINATGSGRDRRMATNVRRALDAAGPDGRLIVWAHNAHVSTGSGWMGAYLREWLGNDLYVIGFEFSSGAFRSRSVSGIRDYDLPPASADYYAADLARLAAPMVFLDFARASRVPLLAAWPDAPRRSHDIDERFYVTRFVERWHTENNPWSTLYDGVAFVRETTAARALFSESARSR